MSWWNTSVVRIGALAGLILFSIASSARAQDLSTDPGTGPQLRLQRRPAVTPAAPVAAQQIVLPAGTPIMAALDQPLQGKTAKVGDLVYLVTAAPVATENRIVVPVGSYLLARVTAVQHGGRHHRGGSMHIQPTSILLPNGYSIPLTATINSAPGASAGVDGEGTLKQPSDAHGRVARDVKAGAAAGTMIGMGVGGDIGAAQSGTFGGGLRGGLEGAAGGAIVGAGAGLAAAGLGMLLSKGPDVDLPIGTRLILSTSAPAVVPLAALNFAGFAPAPPPEPPSRYRPVRRRRRRGLGWPVGF